MAPAYTETALTQGYLGRQGVQESMIELMPAGRLGTVDDVVGPVVFLASPRAGFVTGQVLVDGGRALV